MLPSASSFSIRVATPADARTFTELRGALFRELGKYPVEATALFEAASSEAFSEAIERGQCIAWLAENRDAIAIGSLALLIYPRLPSPLLTARAEGYLLNVYTMPAWRRNGVAGALVSASLAKARSLGLGRLRLHATEAGAPVYSNAGFAHRSGEMELSL